jgi:PAS domain S-box-containing protein
VDSVGGCRQYEGAFYESSIMTKTDIQINELAEDKLRSELVRAYDLLRTVIDENPNIILMKDWDGKFLIGNRALANLYGTTPDKLEGLDDGAFNPNTEQVAFYLQNVRDIMSQTETQIVMEESTNAATGETHYYQSIKKPLIAADGKKQILVIANDVTELKVAQQKLEESERRLRYVLDATGEGVWDWDIKSGMVTHNSQWCKIAGLDDNYLQHPVEKFGELLHVDDKERVFESLQRCLEGHGHYQSEHRMTIGNNRIAWVLDRGDVVERDEAGKPLRMVGSFVDITARKEVELALGVRTELLNAIFELSPDGFISFDEAKQISYVSPAFTQMTGLNAMQLLGIDEPKFTDLLASLCVASSRFKGVEALRENAASSTSDKREIIELSLGAKRILEVGLRSSDNHSVSQILYFREITHETELDQLKSEFLSTAAHELRTPMASIYGFAELMLAQEFDAESRREFLSIIYKQSELMTAILNELLDLSRIEARRGKDFVFEALSAQALIKQVVSAFILPEGRSTPTLTVHQEARYIHADYKKAYQAILNVLSNAYKYSPHGGDVSITLVMETCPNNTSLPCVGIRVIDHGIGMTDEQLTRVFERFYRADTSGKITGTGLGMSIVQEIVLLHGGQVTLESELGLGTSVTLWFPASAAVNEHQSIIGEAQ